MECWKDGMMMKEEDRTKDRRRKCKHLPVTRIEEV
jgi:hypothetical protein